MMMLRFVVEIISFFILQQIIQIQPTLGQKLCRLDVVNCLRFFFFLIDVFYFFAV